VKQELYAPAFPVIHDRLKVKATICQGVRQILLSTLSQARWMPFGSHSLYSIPGLKSYTRMVPDGMRVSRSKCLNWRLRHIMVYSKSWMALSV
jgi:hypothetical protein